MAAIDTYGSDITQTGPASNGEAVTPSDTVDLIHVSRGISVSVTGTVAVIMRGGATLTFTMNSGELYPYAVTRVKATGTTATGIVSVY